MISQFAAFLSLAAATTNVALYSEVEVAGARLKITIQEPVDRDKAIELSKWLQATAGNVNLVYGRFPSRNVTIKVIPNAGGLWGGNQAVRFGQVTRKDGGTITLYVNAERPIEEFYGDWTATHEFSHLMLPLLERRYRWISEGFATYYQNILLARSGQYTPEIAWTRLLQGFERGKSSSPHLSPNDAATRRSRGSTMKIYWSGAAIALLADIELRKRSGGRESLDTVLDQLQRCCMPTRRKWTGPALFRKLDALIDEPVFMPLYRRYANSSAFPDVRPAILELGVYLDDGSVRFRSNAAMADIRLALMRSSNQGASNSVSF